MNKPVNFELAKLLKEKSFTSVFTVFSNKYYNNLGDYRVVSYNVKIENNEYEAPTIAEVVMWLYKKYGIWIYISDNSARLGFRYQIQRLKILGENNFSSEKRYDSPTEAYELAIEYVLTNLI